MRFISLRFTIQRQVLDVEMEEVQGLQGDFEKTLAGEASEGLQSSCRGSGPYLPTDS